MALADFYARGAVAASQVLSGFDEQRFKATLERIRVGISFGEDAADSVEGRALIDLLVRLLSRLYPALTIQASRGTEDLARDVKALANRINPNISLEADPTFEIVVGAHAPRTASQATRIFVGSNEWDALLDTERPQPI